MMVAAAFADAKYLSEQVFKGLERCLKFGPVMETFGFSVLARGGVVL